MMRSLFAGVSGLRTEQVAMDVIGNNIANVNTVGFKSSRVTFRELFSQTLRGASEPTTDRGGTNPQQVGLGTALGNIDVLFTQGNLQTTGKDTDLAIQGGGFFVVKAGQNTYYTRAGAFGLDAQGYLIDPGTGYRVQGWTANGGVFPTKDEKNLTDLQIPVGQPVQAQPTANMQYSYNLDASAATGTTYTTKRDVYDSLGTSHTVEITFTKTGNNAWSWTASVDGTSGAGSGSITFDSTGKITGGQTGTVTATLTNGANPLNVTVDFSAITQFAGPTTVEATYRDGFPMGTLQQFTIDQSGVITGVYSNGYSQPLGQVAVALFSNPSGLLKAGDNMYSSSNNSGLEQIGEPGTGGRGAVAPGTLEMSNVDLAQEFIEMITTQRGFQANSRVITTSDEMLQELANIKR